MTADRTRMIFLFLDGVGIGNADDRNPFYVAKTRYLPFYNVNKRINCDGIRLPDNTPVKAIDPLLGVEGLPQSASGQTSLYTGVNVPRLLGEHKGSYPTRSMRKIIREKNILLRLKKQGLNAVFINAYPIYTHLFAADHIQIKPSGELHFSQEFPALFKRRISVTTCMMISAGQMPFSEKDVELERSLFQEYTNCWLKGKGLDIPEFTPEKAAQILANASQTYDFMLYEYFQTDIFGHRRGFDEKVKLVSDLDRLFSQLLSRLNPLHDTLVLTSDHGNIEDSASKSHTLNPVPLISWGRRSRELRNSIHCLTDVVPAILHFFKN